MIADSNEVPAFLDAHPDVEAIELLITDPGGMPRGKLIAREESLALYSEGPRAGADDGPRLVPR